LWPDLGSFYRTYLFEDHAIQGYKNNALVEATQFNASIKKTPALPEYTMNFAPAVRRSVFGAKFSLSSKRYVHIEERIKQLGYLMPPSPPEPKGNYMTFVKAGNMLHIAGHLPIPVDGRPMIVGRLGENMTVEQGQEAARLAGLQMLATVKGAIGDLDKVKRIIKLVGFVNSTNDFHKQAMVMNGCSDLMGEVFGVEIGRHARSALGSNVLPFGVPVEIEGIIEFKD
jgi:enamine deaminase RidA (YjgF/YER057c/UK114 family)